MIHGLKAKEGWTFTGSVHGWRAKTGAVWTVNTLVRLVVPMEGIDEDMWIYERTLKMSRGGGQFTELKIMPKYALLIGESPS